MKKQHQGSNGASLISQMPVIRSAELVYLEPLRENEEGYKAVPSGLAIQLHATQHLMQASRRAGGFWHRIGVVTGAATSARTGIVYVLAEEELHLVALAGAEPEVREFLAGAYASGHLLLHWVTAEGDRRLAQLQFDASLIGMLGGAEQQLPPDVLSTTYDVVRAVTYALGDETLQRVGIDPSTVARHVVHVLATPSMLDQVHNLARSVTVTKH
jgi:hypothetical protein